MSYSPKLGSAFNKTRLRDPEHPDHLFGYVFGLRRMPWPV